MRQVREDQTCIKLHGVYISETLLQRFTQQQRINLCSCFHFSSLELPYTPPLENKQRKTFSSKMSLQHMLTNGSKSRNLPKTRGTIYQLLLNKYFGVWIFVKLHKWFLNFSVFRVLASRSLHKEKEVHLLMAMACSVFLYRSKQ